MTDGITAKQFHESEGVGDWRVVGDGACAFFRTSSFAARPSPTDVMPFWRAALGYEPRRDSPGEDLVDPKNHCPGFWFEQMKAPRPDGGGAIHVAVWVPSEQADARVAAALAAGGHMVRDRFAPSWWTLADEAGNEIDIATTRGRD